QLRAEMPERWHINAYAQQDTEVGPKPTLIAIESNPGISWYRPDAAKDPTDEPPPAGLESWGTVRYYEGPAVWTVPIDVSAEAEPGPLTIKGMLGYHACEGLDRCEATPVGIAFEATLHVGETTESDPAPVKFSKERYKAVADFAKTVEPSAADAPAFTLGNLEIVEFGGKTATSLRYVLLAALAGGLLLNLMPCVL